MSKIKVNQIESLNNSTLTLQGNIKVEGSLISDSTAPPPSVLSITLGWCGTNGADIKERGTNKYDFGLNFGATGTPGSVSSPDWSALTGWTTNPYGPLPGIPASAPGINTDFIDATAQFKPDYLLYPKGGMSLYWDWTRNDFVSASEFTFPPLQPGNSLLPDEYNKLTASYKEVRPAAHIDNFATWSAALESEGVGDKMYIYGNLYLETNVNTTNPNLTSASVKNQAITYKSRAQNPLNVTYIELGHEYHLQGSSEPDTPPSGGYAVRFPTGSDYADVYLRYLEQIRSDARLNNVYCAANLCTSIGGDPNNPQVKRRNSWNQTFIETYLTNSIYTSDPVLHKLDAISIHNFFNVGTNSNAYNTFESWILSAADIHYTNLRTVIDSCKSHITSFVTTPPITHIMPKFWAIGYNLNDQQFTTSNSNAISGCWGHGLFNLHYQFRLMSDPDIVLTAFHASHGGRQYGLFFTTERGFGTINGANTTDMYDLTATGYAFKILREAEENTDFIRPLVIPGASQALGVYGMSFQADLSNIIPGPGTKAQSLLFINLSGSPRTLDLSGIIHPSDTILYRESLKADIRARIGEKTLSGKTIPTETIENEPAASSMITRTIEPYEILHIAIRASNNIYENIDENLNEIFD